MEHPRSLGGDMKTTADFLDALRAKLSLSSDGQLAAHLGIHRQYISRYRNNVISFDDEMSLRVAEILEIDGSYVMACMHHQRAKNPEVKAAWKHTAEALYGLAAALAGLAVLPFLPGMESDSLSGFALLGLFTSGGEGCILCQMFYMGISGGVCHCRGSVITLLRRKASHTVSWFAAQTDRD